MADLVDICREDEDASGMPTSAGTSNAPRGADEHEQRERQIAGIASRSEIRHSVSNTEAPLMRAASSMSAFEARNVAPSSRNTSGDHKNPVDTGSSG